ncbi:alpha/beta fold hydrolase [Marixanthomonas spongiae]|uniref:Alpha/beta hydrolase n=1 Tax=Marixanthomonas spongiae TaxID=2174845 RepID=A0A2U0I814_9FLAO|nr:alpha/beta fold hydrolase [Marixanthomonas spongiae]PVW17239.1 alpha/beta hydrolase [Marixanthomonas spongiae]
MKLLHSQILGEGSPFLILHGFLGMSDNWKTLGKRFAEAGCQVHLIDQRNHGRSFHAPEHNYQVMAEDIKAYCDHHNLNDIVLLGHSMGGKTAMHCATQFPGLVSKLIVADIAPKEYPQHHQDILKGLASLDFSEIESRSQADEKLSEYVKEKSVRQFLLKNLYWKNKGELALRMNLPVLTQHIDEVGKPLGKDAIFKGDTLFLAGGKSGYIQQMDEMLIAKHFPKAKIETIKKAGHWLHAENPDKFYENVMDFL